MKIRSSGAVWFIGALLVAACGNDFDALFQADASTAADAGASGEDSGSTSTDQGGDDASTEKEDAGGTPRPDAGPPETINCPPFRSSCDERCRSGSACSVLCGAEDDCNLGCDGCQGNFVCTGQNEVCDVRCGADSICDTSCSGEECFMTCAAGSSCLLRCQRRSGPCKLECQGGERRECGDGIFTCNRDCP